MHACQIRNGNLAPYFIFIARPRVGFFPTTFSPPKWCDQVACVAAASAVGVPSGRRPACASSAQDPAAVNQTTACRLPPTFQLRLLKSCCMLCCVFFCVFFFVLWCLPSFTNIRSRTSPFSSSYSGTCLLHRDWCTFHLYNLPPQLPPVPRSPPPPSR